VALTNRVKGGHGNHQSPQCSFASVRRKPPVKRFGFHNLGRHSLATFLMDEQENPAVVQAIMRHAKMDMTLCYSHSRRKAKRAAQEKVLEHLLPAKGMRVPMREPQTIR
jgi:integrase